MFIGAVAIYVLYLKWNVNQADFLVFYSAALSVLHHRSPFPALGTSKIYSGSSFVYPYLTAWLFTPFTLFDRSRAELLYIAVSIVALVVGLRFMGVKRHSHILLFLLSSATIVSWQIGTLNPLFVLGIGLAWRIRSKVVGLGIIIAILGFAKLFLVPMVLWLLVSKRYRAFLVALVSLLVMASVNFVLGPLTIMNYLRMLSTLARHEGIVGYSTSALLRTIGLGVYSSEAIVIVIATLIAIYFYRYSAANRDERLLVGGFVISALVITPILWVSYLPLFGVALIFTFPVELALAIYFICSWVVTTPDRVHLLGIFLIVVIGILLVTRESFARLGRFVPNGKYLLLQFRNLLTREGVFKYACIAVVILVAPAIFGQEEYPLVITQFALMYLLPVCLYLSRRKYFPRVDSTSRGISRSGLRVHAVQIENSEVISSD